MEVTMEVNRFCFLFSFPLGPCRPSRWQRSREGCETWFLGPCAHVSVESVSPAPLDSPSNFQPPRHSRLVDLQKVQTLDAFSQPVKTSAVLWCSVNTWVLVACLFSGPSLVSCLHFHFPAVAGFACPAHTSLVSYKPRDILILSFYA
ncbi:hypothetical protein V6N13_139022 [Hibiscus sabdariffa]